MLEVSDAAREHGDSSRREQRVLRQLIAVGIVLLAGGVAHGQGAGAFGSIPGRVAARVSIQFSPDEADKQIAHSAMRSIGARSGSILNLELENGQSFVLPVAPGQAEELIEIVVGATSEVLHLEYHPTAETSPGLINATWTLTSRAEVMGDGLVPLGRSLYQSILRLAPADIAPTGVFAPISEARIALAALLDHVSNDDGRRTNELADAFLAAVDNSRLHLGYYKTHDGEPVTEDFLQGLRDRGVARSAEQYWQAATRKYRQSRTVSPTLDKFEAEWNRCPSDISLKVPFPGRSNEVVSEELVRELRHMAVQGLLDRAYRLAQGRRIAKTREAIAKFQGELAAANVTASRFTLGDFTIKDKAASEERLEYLVKLARGETGFWGFFRASWRRVTGNDPEGGNDSA